MSPIPKPSILFVEDDTTILHMMEIVLQQFGYAITPVLTPKVALDLFREAPDSYDLVITDYAMPEMDGEQLADQLRSIRTDIPVILCSGSDFSMHENVIHESVNHFIRKPYDIDKLRSVVETALQA